MKNVKEPKEFEQIQDYIEDMEIKANNYNYGHNPDVIRQYEDRKKRLAVLNAELEVCAASCIHLMCGLNVI